MRVIKYEGHPGQAKGKIVVVGESSGPVVDSVSAQTEKGKKSRARRNLAELPHEGDPQGSPIMPKDRTLTELFEGQDGLEQQVAGEEIDGEIGQEALEEDERFRQENKIA